MLRMLNKNHKPVKAIEKGKSGIYWSARGGQHYFYDGKSNYVTPMFSDETIPINHKYLKPSSYSRLYKLTPKEVDMHIAILRRGIPQIRYEIRWLEEHLSLTSRKRTRNS